MENRNSYGGTTPSVPARLQRQPTQTQQPQNNVVSMQGPVKQATDYDYSTAKIYSEAKQFYSYGDTTNGNRVITNYYTQTTDKNSPYYQPQYWVFSPQYGDENKTLAAESDLLQMYNAVNDAVNKGYSDSWIKGNISAKNYPGLAALDKDTLLTRQLQYWGDETINGMIYAARNPDDENSQDIRTAAGMYAMGYGNLQQLNFNSEAAKDPTNEMYHPYMQGNFTDSKEALDNTISAKRDLDLLKQACRTRLERGYSVEDVYDMYFGNELHGLNYGVDGEPSYDTLYDMEYSRQHQTAIPLTENVDFAGPYFKQWLYDQADEIKAAKGELDAAESAQYIARQTANFKANIPEDYQELVLDLYAQDTGIRAEQADAKAFAQLDTWLKDYGLIGAEDFGTAYNEAVKKLVHKWGEGVAPSENFSPAAFISYGENPDKATNDQQVAFRLGMRQYLSGRLVTNGDAKAFANKYGWLMNSYDKKIYQGEYGLSSGNMVGMRAPNRGAGKNRQDNVGTVVDAALDRLDTARDKGEISDEDYLNLYLEVASAYENYLGIEQPTGLRAHHITFSEYLQRYDGDDHIEDILANKINAQIDASKAAYDEKRAAEATEIGKLFGDFERADIRGEGVYNPIFDSIRNVQISTEGMDIEHNKSDAEYVGFHNMYMVQPIPDLTEYGEHYDYEYYTLAGYDTAERVNDIQRFAQYYGISFTEARQLMGFETAKDLANWLQECNRATQKDCASVVESTYTVFNALMKAETGTTVSDLLEQGAIDQETYDLFDKGIGEGETLEAFYGVVDETREKGSAGRNTGASAGARVYKKAMQERSPSLGVAHGYSSNVWDIVYNGARLGWIEHKGAWVMAALGFADLTTEERENKARYDFHNDPQAYREKLMEGINQVDDPDLRSAYLFDLATYNGDIFKFDFNTDKAVIALDAANRKVDAQRQALAEEMQDLLTPEAYKWFNTVGTATNSTLLSAEAIIIADVLGAMGASKAGASLMAQLLTTAPVEGGQVAYELKQAGISSKTANFAGLAAGVATALSEYGLEGLVQKAMYKTPWTRAIENFGRIDTAANGMKVASMLTDRGLGKTATRILTFGAKSAMGFMNITRNAAFSALGEGLQEVQQDFTTNLIKATAAWYEGQDGSQFLGTGEDYLNTFTETIKSSFVQLGSPLSLGPSVLNTARAYNAKTTFANETRATATEMAVRTQSEVGTAKNAQDAALADIKRATRERELAMDKLKGENIDALIDQEAVKLAAEKAIEIKDSELTAQIEELEDKSTELLLQENGLNPQLFDAQHRGEEYNELIQNGDSSPETLKNLNEATALVRDIEARKDEIAKEREGIDEQLAKLKEEKQNVREQALADAKKQALEGVTQEVIEAEKQKAEEDLARAEADLADATARHEEAKNRIKNTLQAYQEEVKQFQADTRAKAADINSRSEEGDIISDGLVDIALGISDEMNKINVTEAGVRERAIKASLVKQLELSFPGFKVEFRNLGKGQKAKVVAEGKKGVIILNRDLTSFELFTGELGYELGRMAQIDHDGYQPLYEAVTTAVYGGVKGTEAAYNAVLNDLIAAGVSADPMTPNNAIDTASSEVFAYAFGKLLSGEYQNVNWAQMLTKKAPELANNIFDWIATRAKEGKAIARHGGKKMRAQYNEIAKVLDMFSEALKRHTFENFQGQQEAIDTAPMVIEETTEDVNEFVDSLITSQDEKGRKRYVGKRVLPIFEKQADGSYTIDRNQLTGDENELINKVETADMQDVYNALIGEVTVETVAKEFGDAVGVDIDLTKTEEQTTTEEQAATEEQTATAEQDNLIDEVETEPAPEPVAEQPAPKALDMTDEQRDKRIKRLRAERNRLQRKQDEAAPLLTESTAAVDQWGAETEEDENAQPKPDRFELQREYDKRAKRIQKIDTQLEELENPAPAAVNVAEEEVAPATEEETDPIAQKAQEQTWEEFQENAKDKGFRDEIKTRGIKNPRQYWIGQKLKGFTIENAHEITKEEAIATIRDNVGENTLNGWFVNGDSGYKPQLEMAILNDENVRNAGLNIAYQNYKDTTNSDISFEEFLQSDIPMFRGDRGQATTSDDVFTSYTSDRATAEQFGDNITEETFKPIETLGSYQTTGEAEFLVPTEVIQERTTAQEAATEQAAETASETTTEEAATEQPTEQQTEQAQPTSRDKLVESITEALKNIEQFDEDTQQKLLGKIRGLIHSIKNGNRGWSTSDALNTPLAVIRKLMDNTGATMYQMAKKRGGKAYEVYSRPGFIQTKRLLSRDINALLRGEGEHILNVIAESKVKTDLNKNGANVNLDMFNEWMLRGLNGLRGKYTYTVDQLNDFGEKLHLALVNSKNSKLFAQLEEAHDSLKAYYDSTAIQQSAAYVRESPESKKVQGYNWWTRTKAYWAGADMYGDVFDNMTNYATHVRQSLRYLPYAKNLSNMWIGDSDTAHGFIDVDGNLVQGTFTLHDGIMDAWSNDHEYFEQHKDEIWKNLNVLLACQSALDRIDHGRNPFSDMTARAQSDVAKFLGTVGHPTRASIVQTINTLSQDSHLVQAADNVRTWWRNIMQMAVDEGLISQETYDKFQNENPMYAPLQRDMSTIIKKGRHTNTAKVSTQGDLVATNTGVEFRKAKGHSDRAILDPLQSFAEMAQVIGDKMVANRTAQEFAKAYDLAPYDTIGVFAGEISNGQARVLAKHGGADILNVYYGDGTHRSFMVNNEVLLDLLQGKKLGKETNKFFRGVGRFTRLMASLTTTNNPFFAIRNAIRDYQTSVNYGSWTTNYFTGLFKWIPAFAECLRYTNSKLWNTVMNDTNAGRASQQLADFLQRGGEGFMRKEMTRWQSDNVHNAIMGDKFAVRALSGAKALITFNTLNDAIEMASRYVEYKYGKNETDDTKGATDQSKFNAFMASREATVDFAQSGYGRYAQIARQVIPFFNATLQGWYRTERMFSRAERGRLAERFAKTFTNNVITGALSAGMCLFGGMVFGGDDDDWDEQAAEYLKLSKSLKEGFIILPLSGFGFVGAKDFIRVPLLQDGLGKICFNIGRDTIEQVARSMRGEDITFSEGVKNVAADLLGLTWEIFSEPFTRDNIVVPAIDVMLNTTYYGSDLVNKSKMTYDDPEQWGSSSTPNVFFHMSGAIRSLLKALGISDPQSVKLLTSPAGLEYLTKEYTGVFGQLVIPALSRDKYTGEKAGLWAGIKKTVAGSFTIDAESSNDISTNFKDAVDYITSITNLDENSKGIAPLSSILTSDERLQAKAEAVDLLDELKGIQNEVKELWKQYNEAMSDTELDEKEKAQLAESYRKQINIKEAEGTELVNSYKTRWAADLSIFGTIADGWRRTQQTLLDEGPGLNRGTTTEPTAATNPADLTVVQAGMPGLNDLTQTLPIDEEQTAPEYEPEYTGERVRGIYADTEEPQIETAEQEQPVTLTGLAQTPTDYTGAPERLRGMYELERGARQYMGQPSTPVAPYARGTYTAEQRRAAINRRADEYGERFIERVGQNPNLIWESSSSRRPATSAQTAQPSTTSYAGGTSKYNVSARVADESQIYGIKRSKGDEWSRREVNKLYGDNLPASYYAELNEYMNADKKSQSLLPIPATKWTMDGVDYEVKDYPGAYADVANWFADAYIEGYNELKNDPVYQNASQKERIDMFESVRSNANTVAKRQFVLNYVSAKSNGYANKLSETTMDVAAHLGKDYSASTNEQYVREVYGNNLPASWYDNFSAAWGREKNTALLPFPSASVKVDNTTYYPAEYSGALKDVYNWYMDKYVPEYNKMVESSEFKYGTTAQKDKLMAALDNKANSFAYTNFKVKYLGMTD